MNGQSPYGYGYGPPSGPPPAQPSPYGPGPNRPPPQQQQQYHQPPPMPSAHGTSATHYANPSSHTPYIPQQSTNRPPPSSYPYSPATPSTQYPPQSPTPYDNQQQQSLYQGGPGGYSPLAGPSRPQMPPHDTPTPIHTQRYGGAPNQSYQPPQSQQNYSPSFARPPPQSLPPSSYPTDGAYDPHAPQSAAGNGANGGGGSSEDAAMRAYMARSRPRPPPLSGQPPTADPRRANGTGMMAESSSQINGGAYNGYSPSPHVGPVGRPLSGPPPGVGVRQLDHRTEAEKAASAWRDRQQLVRPFANGLPSLQPSPVQTGPPIPVAASRPPPPAGYNYSYNAPQRPQPPSAQPSVGRPGLPSVGLSPQPSVPVSHPSRSNQTRPATLTARPMPPSTLPARPPSSAGWQDRRSVAGPNQTQSGRPGQKEAGNGDGPAQIHGRLPLPPQRNVRGRTSPPVGARARAPIPARPISARSRSPPSRRKADSRTPTPDPLQEVFLVGLDSDVTPDQLHEMIDKLCSSSDLTTADEVLLLRDRTTRVLNGRAIATFPRIADAIRFANAHGPWIEDVERFFGPPPKADGEDSGENQSDKRKRIRVNHGGNVPDDGDEKAKAATPSLKTEDGGAVAAADQQLDNIKQWDAQEDDMGATEPTQTETIEPPSTTVSQSTVSSDTHNAAPDGEQPVTQEPTRPEDSKLPIKEETSQEPTVQASSATGSSEPATQSQDDDLTEGDITVAPSTEVADTVMRRAEGEAAPRIPATEAVTPPSRNALGEVSVEEPAAQSDGNREPSLTPTDVATSSTVAPLLGEGEKRTSQLLSNKKVALNIANWTKKQEELHSTLPTSATSAALSSLPDDEPQDHAQETVSGPSLDAIMEGTPPADVDIDFFSDRTALCCYLCGRKFKTMDVLNRHPRESKLHSANLLEEDKRRSGGEAVRKAKAATKSAGMKRKAGLSGFVPVQSSPTNDGGDATGETKYRDRALERRAVFGSENPAPASKKAKGTRSFEGPAAPAPTAAPRGVDDKIEEDNVGNKMLQMMGWSEGEVLGNTGGGLEKPIEAVMYAKGAGLGAGSAGKSIGGSDAAGNTPGWKARLDQARDGRMSRYQEAQSGGKDGGS
ncbi:hypothetical protein BCV69DRAFT_298024 [Microstroma glucosiphilum]|uniref:G-patch domain-containing protein n=1 Tax=Pseudomicrostroma glucosiphilum TaxID=1684307 RepID=A0A316U972_9BASI|nr:hypothetical protein BCV69DRAFT_298024 [Pseudomicrostroma glucosiphilum]PWN21817.1 hypothetical protein BCV69DRAFT_298024 [Pseudomicrostroma glucosiphilum]